MITVQRNNRSQCINPWAKRFVVHNLIVYLLFRMVFVAVWTFHFSRPKENQIKTENTIGMEARRLETTNSNSKQKLEEKENWK